MGACGSSRWTHVNPCLRQCADQRPLRRSQLGHARIRQRCGMSALPYSAHEISWTGLVRLDSRHRRMVGSNQGYERAAELPTGRFTPGTVLAISRDRSSRTRAGRITTRRADVLACSTVRNDGTTTILACAAPTLCRCGSWSMEHHRARHLPFTPALSARDRLRLESSVQWATQWSWRRVTVPSRSPAAASSGSHTRLRLVRQLPWVRPGGLSNT